MTLETIKDSIPDYARDLKLNLGTVLTTQGSPGLTDGAALVARARDCNRSTQCTVRAFDRGAGARATR